MNKPDYTMAYDIFEKAYADEISWRIETILGDVEDVDDYEYDSAYEQAIKDIAEEKGIELV